MNVGAAIAELFDALDVITGLRTVDWSAQAVSPPVAMPSFPMVGTYDSTYARGMDEFTLPVVVVVGKADQRSADAVLREYLAGAGPRSVKAAVENHDYTELDVVHVQSWEVDTVSIGGVEYLSAEFTVRIIGKGTP